MHLFDLSGQKALVTGGSGTLGRAMAEGLLEAGAEVGIIGVSDRVHAVADELSRNAGRPVAGLQADLTDRGERARTFEAALAALGTLDILVTAHGTLRRHRAEDFPLEDWDRVLEANLTSVFELNQLAGQHMLAKGRGKIVNIASVLSFQGGWTVSAYAASKGGVVQITRALANEWAARGVNVNAIVPGYFESRLNTMLKRDPMRGPQILDRIPAGRWGEPEELKGAVIYLASRASDYVHGATLVVDGGWMAR